MKKFYVLLLSVLIFQASEGQTTVTIVADKDNTIYSAFPDNSNGSGQYLFAGKNSSANAGSVQRALLHFNLATIPASAVITAATLTVYTNRTGPTATGIELRKVISDWGEGASDAAQREAQGVAATANDATWRRKMFPSSSWTTEGGDFVATNSATVATIAGGITTANMISISAANLLKDVQDWYADPNSNFGWMIKANDESQEASVKRFVSRNSGTTEQRPTLSVTYSVALPVTLSAFSATVSKQNALLKWSTATELNNDYFEIEHSTNGRDFASVGIVKASGRSAGDTYTFTHENIYNGKHFYRILDVDKNGHKKHSQILTLSLTGNAALQLFPNPATSVISVASSALLIGSSFTINSLAGQVLLRGKISEQKINIHTLTAGQYWFLVKTDKGELLKAQFLKK